MAQDAFAPRAHGADEVGRFRSAVMAIRRLDLVPKTPALGPVDYKNVGLVAYVSTTVVAAIVVGAISLLPIRVKSARAFHADPLCVRAKRAAARQAIAAASADHVP